MELLRTAALLAATMTMGIGAGVYQLYAFAIMPGLRRTDDRTFVGAFQQIDTAIVVALDRWRLCPAAGGSCHNHRYPRTDQRRDQGGRGI